MRTISEDDKVLFVDDEQMVLQSIRRSMIDQEFESMFANSAHKALEILEENQISVVVTDLKMPVMGGLELLKIVQEKYPDVVRIVLTGYYQVSTVLTAINTGHIHRYLTKPWKMEEQFLPTILQAIEYNHILNERRYQSELLEEQNKILIQKHEEISKLKTLAETSDNNKTLILNHITKEVIPYLMDVLRVTADPEKINNSTAMLNTIMELNKTGMGILRLLRKVESLLKDRTY